MNSHPRSWKVFKGLYSVAIILSAKVGSHLSPAPHKHRMCMLVSDLTVGPQYYSDLHFPEGVKTEPGILCDESTEGPTVRWATASLLPRAPIR